MHTLCKLITGYFRHDRYQTVNMSPFAEMCLYRAVLSPQSVFVRVPKFSSVCVPKSSSLQVAKFSIKIVKVFRCVRV